MSGAAIVVVCAGIASLGAVVWLVVVTGGLRKEISRLRSVVDDLDRRTIPLVAEAHRVVDQASSEMERVGAVLESTESVTQTVDSASRLAYRAFANPVVKVLAVRAGAAGGLRRLRTGGPVTERKE